MKISSTGVNKIINIYENNSSRVEKTKQVVKKDSVEISKIGKSLSSLAIDDKGAISQEKIDRIRSEVANGTYKVDGKLVAQKMIAIMKGRDV